MSLFSLCRTNCSAGTGVMAPIAVELGALGLKPIHAVFDYIAITPAIWSRSRRLCTPLSPTPWGRLVPNHWRFAGDALAALRREGLEGRGLLDKVVALEQEHSALDGALEQWQATPVRRRAASIGARAQGVG